MGTSFLTPDTTSTYLVAERKSTVSEVFKSDVIVPANGVRGEGWSARLALFAKLWEHIVVAQSDRVTGDYIKGGPWPSPLGIVGSTPTNNMLP